jgi:hypothetical protein
MTGRLGHEADPNSKRPVRLMIVPGAGRYDRQRGKLLTIRVTLQ